MSSMIKHQDLLTLNISPCDKHRFYSSVLFDNSDRCWEWQLALSGNGYGVFSVCRSSHSTTILAHRVAFFLFWGIDPQDYLVLHECDNRKCCNPNHLFVGTYDDNNKDRNRKGRTRYGVSTGMNNGHAKLSSEQVSEMRSARKNEQPTPFYRELATRFGVTKDYARRICAGTKRQNG